MINTLIVPRRRVALPRPPSYQKLLMAFGLGAGTTLFDKSRYKAHGTISGADWATGVHGYCLDFNRAIPDYVEIPAAYDHLDFTSEDFSFIFRIKFDVFTGSPVIFCRGEAGVGGYYIQCLPTGLLWALTIQAGTNQKTQTAAGALVVGTWYTIGVSRDGAAITLYRNGVDVTSISGTHVDPVSSAETALIGIYKGAAVSAFDGKMEFLAAFGKALTASEHLAWHNALA